MTDKKESSLMGNMKDSMKLGIGSMAGMGALGAMQNVPGMPAEASNVAGIAGVGITLANVGQLSKTGMSLANSLTGQQQQPVQQPKPKPKKQLFAKKSPNKNSVVNKILYG